MSVEDLLSPSGLTVKQLKFCIDYIKCGCNLSAVAEMNGYSSANASKYLKDPHVMNFLLGKMAEMEKKFDVTFEEIYSELWRIKKLCVPDAAVDLEGTNPKVAISALAEMNKMKGNYAASRIELTNKEDPDIKAGHKLSEEYLKEHEKEL